MLPVPSISMLATGLVQLACLLTTIDTRAPAPLGAGPRRFARIVALNIILAVEVGRHNLPRVMDSYLWQPANLLPVAITSTAFALCVLAWCCGPGLLRKTCVFAAVTFAAALLHPQVSLDEEQWMVMSFPGFGNRYWKPPRNAKEILDGLRWAVRASFSVEFEGAPITTVIEVTEKRTATGVLHGQLRDRAERRLRRAGARSL